MNGDGDDGADRTPRESPAGWHDGAPDPLWSRPTLSMRARCHSLGLAIEVHANAAWLLELATDAFGPAVARAATDDRPPDLQLSLVAGPPPGGDGWPAMPNGGVTATGSPTVRPIFREHDGRFVAFDGAGNGVTADLRAGVAVAWVCAGAAADSVRTLLVESALWRLATYRGLLALHGAAVVVDGVAVVVRGAAGTGKSSVALAADVAGWAVLAEEVAWIDPVPWVIWPAARRVHMDDEAALRRAAGIEGAGHGRWSVESTPIRPSGRIAVPLSTPAASVAVPIGPIVLLDAYHGASASGSARSDVAWRAIDAGPARARCEADRIVGEHAQPQATWDAVLGRLCGDGAYDLRGGDPAARVVAIGDIVRHWRHGRHGRRGGASSGGSVGRRSRDGSDAGPGEGRTAGSDAGPSADSGVESVAG